MWKLSSMRNGLKLRKFALPIDLLTVAPAPSACSIASTDRTTLRDTREAVIADEVFEV